MMNDERKVGVSLGVECRTPNVFKNCHPELKKCVEESEDRMILRTRENVRQLCGEGSDSVYSDHI